jgi:hypothetical protein
MSRFPFAQTSMAAAAAVCALAFSLLICGCQTKVERQAAFTAALNNYYSARQDCLFPDPIKFPIAPDTKNRDEKQEFDALVKAGLLLPEGTQKAAHVRRTAHARHEGRGAYELSDVGRLDWTADQARIGYGNFCFGHPQVNAIQNSAEIAGVTPTRYKVSYRDRVILPAWAAEPQVEKAFPEIVKDSSGQTSTATMVKSSSGWKVQNVSPPVTNPMG